MSYTKSEKGIYWKAGEVLELRMTKMYTINKYKDTAEFVIGDKKFEHFLKSPDGKFTVVSCEGKDCPHCKEKNKAVVKFVTTVMEGGKEYYCDLAVTLSRELGKLQKTAKDFGRTDADVLDTLYRVKKLSDRPWWEVEMVAGAPKKASVPIDDLPDLDTMDGDTAESPLFTKEDRGLLLRYEGQIRNNLKKNPTWDFKAALRNAFKNAGWDADKQEKAIALFGNGEALDTASMEAALA
jgi:hypothetical protein